MTQEMQEQFMAELKSLTERDAISIEIDTNRTPTLTDSKFGGVPYWDMRMDYPKCSSGHLLMLLAQINLDDLHRQGINPEHQLPEHGLLQFFIDIHDDWCFGMDSDFSRDETGALRQDGYRVVYHEQIDYSITEEQVKSIGMPLSTESQELYSPLLASYAITMKQKKTYINLSHFQFKTVAEQAARTVGWNLLETKSIYSQIPQKLMYMLCGDHDEFGHWMLGYSEFTQDDPRNYIKELSNYTVQLFQMDSVYCPENDIDIMWGDSGVANFLISPEDLKNKRFSNVLYTWDCF